MKTPASLSINAIYVNDFDVMPAVDGLQSSKGKVVPNWYSVLSDHFAFSCDQNNKMPQISAAFGLPKEPAYSRTIRSSIARDQFEE